MKKIVYVITNFLEIATTVSCKEKKNIPQATSNLIYTTNSSLLNLYSSDKSDNELGFYIQESIVESSWETKSYVGQNSLQYTYTVYQLSYQASYRIVAYNEDGESDPSNSGYVPTYISAYTYIYVCPSSTSGFCGDSHIVLDGNCRQKTSEYRNRGWYNSVFEVVVNNNYVMQFCQGCVRNCGQAAPLVPPSFS